MMKPASSVLPALSAAAKAAADGGGGGNSNVNIVNNSGGGEDGVIRATPEQATLIRDEMERMKREEAERPELFEARLDCNDIMRAAHASRDHAARGEDPRTIRARPELAAFAVQYPVIFSKCCDPSIPLTFLPMMLDRMRAIMEQRTSKDAATDDFCTAINQHYVSPLLKDLHRRRGGDNDNDGR